MLSQSLRLSRSRLPIIRDIQFFRSFFCFLYQRFNFTSARFNSVRCFLSTPLACSRAARSAASNEEKLPMCSSRPLFKQRTTWDFGRLFFYDFGGNFNTFPNGVFSQFGELSVNRKNLLVLDISGLASIQKEFLFHIFTKAEMVVLGAQFQRKSKLF